MITDIGILVECVAHDILHELSASHQTAILCHKHIRVCADRYHNSILQQFGNNHFNSVFYVSQNLLRVQQIVTILLILRRSHLVLLYDDAGCVDIKRCLIHVESHQPDVLLERFGEGKGFRAHPTINTGKPVPILYAPNWKEIGFKTRVLNRMVHSLLQRDGESMCIVLVRVASPNSDGLHFNVWALVVVSTLCK